MLFSLAQIHTWAGHSRSRILQQNRPQTGLIEQAQLMGGSSVKASLKLSKVPIHVKRAFLPQTSKMCSCVVSLQLYLAQHSIGPQGQ